MNLNQLRFVKALAATSSFSRAADTCAVTQPTLSNALAQLEEELGGQLFERTTRRVALTGFGRHLLPLVEDVLNARNQLSHSAEGFLNPEHKLVRIGMSPLVDMRLLTCALEPFRREHANVEVVYKECFLDDLDNRLGGEQVDFGIRPTLADRAKHRGLGRCPFYEEPLYFIPRSAGPVTALTAASIRLSEIAQETFVLTPDVCGLTSTIQSLFDQHGLGLKKYPGHALSYQVLQDWAALGIGAAILPLSKISAAHRPGASMVVLADGSEAMVRQEITWNQNAAPSKHVKACRDYFRDVVPELIAGITA
jgi:DNA-binding transcriptional LysR family regulator